MTNSVAVYDSGNDLWKLRSSTGREVVLPHALLILTEDEYQRVWQQSRGFMPDGYARVNGQGLCYGHVADRRGADRRTGAGRYLAEYYGYSLAIMLSHAYKKSGELALFASHAPQDVIYADAIIDSAMRVWHVERDDQEWYFKVGMATTFDEPVGGLMNTLLREDGRGYAHPELSEGDALIIDIGGYTTDFVSVAEGGVIDYALSHSERIGIQDVVRSFTSSLRANNRNLFKDSGDIPQEKIRRAIATGVFSGAGSSLDCSNEAREACSRLLNRISTVYQSEAGGAARWDNIILTGGGSAMLYDRLTSEVLNHQRVLLAEQPEYIHLANVRGGLKLWRLYESEGMLNG